jgi:Zn-dependent M28 family amino/carboxypeptidase
VKDLSPRTQGRFADSAASAANNARTAVRIRLSPASPFPPTYAISTTLANQILSSSGQSVEDLKREIDQSLKPSVFAIRGVTVQTTVKQFDPLETENVLAFIEGSDPQLRDEVLVISSHYDHLGLDSSLKDDQIFNGAADDGSGVVASLEIAQAFAKAKREGFGPRRSLLFINFSGEEKGLLGSAYYTNYQPVVPLEQTVANINMDGVGGIDLRHPRKSQNYIYINGAKGLSEELIDINKRIKSITASSVELTDGPGFNSDDRNFEAQQIPFIYYSTGLTEHYHTTHDEPETIDYDHLARVTRLIFGTVWQVANQDARLRAARRSELIFEGYVCPPCPFACDQTLYHDRGECPVCGMGLMPRYRRRVG